MLRRSASARRLVLLGAVVLAAGMALTPSDASIGLSEAIDDPVEMVNCLEPIPAAAAVGGGPHTVQVRLVTDSVVPDQIGGNIATFKSKVEDILDDAGVNISWSNGTMTGVAAGIVDARTVLNWLAPQHVISGSSPDIVHLITGRDLTSPGLGTTVAGLADCVGGIRYNDRAYSVSEGRSVHTADEQARIAAHEIAHLLGAHHHYANCAEAQCTLMTNLVPLMRDAISTLNTPIIRGHAGTYS